jgi:hypothetical protein
MNRRVSVNSANRALVVNCFRENEASGNGAVALRLV